MADENLPCGHPASLLIRSTESDYSFCELCEMRSQRNDAEAMEERLGARVRGLEAALKRACDMLSSVAGDIEDGGSLDSLRGKYVMAVIGARDSGRDVLFKRNPPQAGVQE